jgi:REP element-mobilizing transposase RayT
MFTGKPGHIKGFDYLGLRQYFLTFCSYSRRRCFVSDDAVVTVRTQIERAAAEQDIALAYRYMPDHVHLVAEGKAENSDCLQFIKRGKQYSGYYYKATFQHVCGSGTAMSRRCATTRQRSVWRDTSSRIPFGPVWLPGSRTIRTRDQVRTRSSRFSRRFNCGISGTGGPADAGHYTYTSSWSA